MRLLAITLLLSVTGLAQASEETETQVYFGDTHLHTTYSFDAFLNKNFTADPDTSYRWAKGEPVIHPYNRTRVQIGTPLDFLVVLAIRCPGEITKARLDILREADAVYLDQIRKHGLYNDIWQAFAVLLPVQTVGVMGDSRTYDFVLALRAVTSTDGMTADYYPYSHEFLGETATRIINEVRGVNRVVYDVTSKPPGTIEWE